MRDAVDLIPDAIPCVGSSTTDLHPARHRAAVRFIPAPCSPIAVCVAEIERAREAAFARLNGAPSAAACSSP